MPQNFDRSYRLGQGAHFIVEGDEYDSAFFAKWAKFFYYLPDVLIVNNIEFDHADIYQDLGEIVKAFRQLVNMVPQNGLILANGTDPNIAELLPDALAPVETFGLEEGAFWRATNLQASAEGTRFTLCRAGREGGSFRLAAERRLQRLQCARQLGRGFSRWPDCRRPTHRPSPALPASSVGRSRLASLTTFSSSTTSPTIPLRSPTP